MSTAAAFSSIYLRRSGAVESPISRNNISSRRTDRHAAGMHAKQKVDPGIVSFRAAAMPVVRATHRLNHSHALAVAPSARSHPAPRSHASDRVAGISQNFTVNR